MENLNPNFPLCTYLWQTTTHGMAFCHAWLQCMEIANHKNMQYKHNRETFFWALCNLLTETSRLLKMGCGLPKRLAYWSEGQMKKLKRENAVTPIWISVPWYPVSWMALENHVTIFYHWIVKFIQNTSWFTLNMQYWCSEMSWKIFVWGVRWYLWYLAVISK